jgi:hypothetical protein
MHTPSAAPASPISVLARVLLLALLVLLVAHAPGALAQPASIGYMKRVFTDPEVNERHETNTRIVTQHWDNSGQLIATFVCPAPGICQPFIPNGSARYAMALEYDSAREELVSSRCGTTADTVPQGQCINAPLSVSMRVRFGEVRWRFVADPRPNRPYAAPFGGQFGPSPRMEFASTGGTDPVKWWLPNKYVNSRGSSLGGVMTPVGTYTLKLDPMRGHCKPVHTNPDAQLSVAEGQLTEFTVRYTGTVCTMSLQSYGTSTTRVPDSAGTFTSDPAGLQCHANPSATTCKAEFPFDSTVRLIGNPNAGYRMEFGRNFTGCSRDEPEARICQILADGDRELSATMYAATTPPPPAPPVTLAAAAGPAAPADATVAKGRTDVPMVQLMLTPANGAARLSALTLQAGGSGRDDLDLTELRVYQDSNANGSLDAGEPLLGRGRLAADNGSLRLALAVPLEFSQATAVLVVADVASTVHSAAAAATAGGVLLALGAVGFVRGRRSARHAPALLAAALLLVACGGGGGGDDTAPVNPPPVTPPATPPATPSPPVLLTYRLQITAVEATDAATMPASLTVTPLPVAGAQITVQQ